METVQVGHGAAVLASIGFILLGLAPVLALTVVSYRMDRRSVWLAVPWLILLGIAVPGVLTSINFMAKAGQPLLSLPMFSVGAVSVGSQAAILVYTIGLAVVGCSRRKVWNSTDA